MTVRPTPRFYRWTAASMWTPGPFRVGRLPPAWRWSAACAISTMARCRSIQSMRSFPAISCTTSIAPGRVHVAQVDPLFVDRVCRRLGSLLRTDDDRCRFSERRHQRAPRPARRIPDPPLSLHRRHPAALLRTCRSSRQCAFRDEAFLEESTARRAERGTFDPSYVLSPPAN